MSVLSRLEATSIPATRVLAVVDVDQMRKGLRRDHRGVTSAVIRTLRRAADTLGGEQALAEALEVSLGQLEEWLAGKGQPINGAYLTALDIVAHGPLWKGPARN